MSESTSPFGCCAPQDMDKAQLDRLFATTFVPRSAQAAAAASAPPPAEHYEALAPGAAEPAVTDAAEVLDAVADWEENTPLAELPDSRAVCTFWTRGACRVVGCPHLHQYYGVRCQHLPHCLLGAGCPFVHTTVADQRRRWAALGLDLVPPPPGDDPASTAAAAAQPRRPQTPPRKTDFPTLGATTTAAAAKHEKMQEEGVEAALCDEPDPDDPELGADVHVETAAERLSLQELKRLYHWVPAAVVETIFVQWFATHAQRHTSCTVYHHRQQTRAHTPTVDGRWTRHGSFCGRRTRSRQSGRGRSCWALRLGQQRRQQQQQGRPHGRSTRCASASATLRRTSGARTTRTASGGA